MRALLAAALLGACAFVHAQSVTLSGSIGNRAILVIDGAAPRTLAPGETAQGVRLVAMQGGQAVVETGGRRLTLLMDTPVSVGPAAGGAGGGTRIVLQADTRGHFMTAGSINGRAVGFMLDTGASLVSLSAADATRLGLDYTHGSPVQMSTANGPTPGWRLQLATVRVGDVELRDVDAIVTQQPMPYVLLGNSFINRFSMRRDADQMVLERRF
jgi:aspartyl protease family protein